MIWKLEKTKQNKTEQKALGCLYELITCTANKPDGRGQEERKHNRTEEEEEEEEEVRGYTKWLDEAHKRHIHSWESKNKTRGGGIFVR